MTVNILIAGNGLDLYHGHNTRYIDFLKYAKGNGWTDNCFMREFIASVEADGVPLENYDPENDNRKWIDCEEEIKDIINAFIDAIPRLDFDFSNSKYGMINKYFEDIVDGEYGCFTPFIDEEEIFHKEWLVQRLREELEGVITFLRDYLRIAEKPSFSTNLFDKDTKFDYGVSFNYTNTIEKYVVDESKVLYIHGSLEKDNMVLGTYGIEDRDFAYFEKYFQRIHKKTGYFNRNKIPATNGINNHFFGVSFGESDTDLLRELLWIDCMNNDMLNITNIVYYYDQHDYEQKIINLIKILGKDNFEKWYYEKKLIFTNS